jgi:hypothetical protein
MKKIDNLLTKHLEYSKLNKDIISEVKNIKLKMGLPSYLIYENDITDEPHEPDPYLVRKTDEISNVADSIPSYGDEEKNIGQQKVELSLNIQVDPYSMRAFDKAVQSLNKTCTKLGLPLPIVTKGDVKKKKIRRKDDISEYYIVELQEIKINVERTLIIPGYKLLAIVDNTVSGFSIVGDEYPPKEFLIPTNQCDACGQNRWRHKIYILKDEKGGYKRFGSDCVKRFLGINPAKFVSFLDFWVQLSKTIEEFSIDENLGGGFGDGKSKIHLMSVDLNKIITISKEVIENDGGNYIKKMYDEYNSKQRTNEGNATSEKVIEKYNNTKNLNSDISIDTQFIDGFKKFIKNESQNTETRLKDLLTKLDVILTEDAARIMDVGIISFGVSFYMKHLEKIDANIPESNHVGTINEKMIFDWLKVIDYKTGEGMYGFWKLWKMVDKNGNIITKFGELGNNFKIGGNTQRDYVHIGDIVAFVAPIVKHDNYRGEKTTQVGRLSAIKLPKKPRRAGDLNENTQLNESIQNIKKWFNILK